MSDSTASVPTPKEDAAAKQSEQQSTGSQAVDNHLKAGSHASKAQVQLTVLLGRQTRKPGLYMYASHASCLSACVAVTNTYAILYMHGLF